jgi:hypothetical protein
MQIASMAEQIILRKQTIDYEIDNIPPEGDWERRTRERIESTRARAGVWLDAIVGDTLHG